MPKPRKRLVSLQDTPYYHCIARCVRRAYLCGEDPVTGFNFEHRRQWLVDRIKLLTSVFAMEVCAYAVMSNHYHVVLRIDADRASLWADQEVAERWTQLFSAPLLVRRWLAGDQLGEAERQALSAIVDEWRQRLYDLSWFMRCLNEAIARMANREDHCRGRFWEGRFKSQALLDEQALLACMEKTRTATTHQISDNNPSSLLLLKCLPWAHTGSMPKPRKRLVSLPDTPYYHCIARCVRRAYLCGEDPVTGFNFEHRRQWLVDRIKLLTSVFAMEVCAYAVMSNHYHVVLRIDASRASLWTDQEVAERWTQLFSAPLLVRRWLAGDQLDQVERQALSSIVDEWRQRLYDLSWFMRCLNEAIARMANREDHCSGRFWEGRFKSQALLDERALLACMAYVDLNPIRAAMATRPEQSDYTSIQERIRQPGNNALRAFAECDDDEAGIPFALKDYLELVDWAGRAIRPDKTGFIPEHSPPILQRLGMESAPVLDYLANKQEAQVNALGSIDNMRHLAAHLGLKFIKGISIARKLCPSLS